MTESVGTIIAESLDRVVAATRKAVLQEVWNEWKRAGEEHDTRIHFDAWLRSKMTRSK